MKLSDSFVQHMYSNKNIESYKESDVEIFVDEWIKIENQEVVYTDRLVKILFEEDELYDPSLINEQALEESALGSFSNYRNKIMVKLKIVF